MRKREGADIFGTAFLDVVSCCFGAVLMLIIIAKDGPIEPETPELIPAAKQSNEQAEQLRSTIAKLIAQLNSAQSEKRTLEKRLVTKSRQVSDLEAKPIEEQPPKAPETTGSMESVYAAGVPIGSEYVVFILDTSGSMLQHWGKVRTTVSQLVAAHPKVKGLQIMNDNGNYLMKGYAKRWIPDTRAARNRAMKKLATWNSFSNSSPAEGLEVALRNHARPGQSVSIYVLGDDFTGASYDKVLAVVDRWNKDRRTGKRKALIHGISFPWGQGDRFPTLMREVAKQNNGVFVSLPRY